jgi:hypothetical protein
MARPVKNNCDYFPHDGSMRNHKKVKAIRSKFGITGYAIWSMLLEYLTDNDGNVFENSEMEFELMAGDFGVSVTEITDIVNYCIRLELLFDKNGFIHSESLDENLSVVYKKRNTSKELSKKQLRVNGKYVTEITQDTVVTVTETPQSKVNKNRVNKSKVKENKIEMRPLVFLLPAEIETLQKEFSELDLNWIYDKLQNSKLAKGYTYKSDYGAICSWVKESLKEEKEKISAKKENGGSLKERQEAARNKAVNTINEKINQAS